MGRHVNVHSPLKFNYEAPYLHKSTRRCIYVTLGGACLDRTEKRLTDSGMLEEMGTNTTYDVMQP